MFNIRFVVVLLAFTFSLPSIADAQRRGSSQDNEGDSVSFVKDVAPIIMSNCGKCHVSQSKGRYSIKSYEALMESDTVVADDPDDSHFIAVIESGEMPPGRAKVNSKDIKTLRQWVSEGAKFDGKDESQMVSQLGDGGGDARSSSRSRSRTGGRRPSRSRSRGTRPNAITQNPILAFFDTDGDGELSLAEIDAAKRLLYSLDRNEDDRLTSDELSDFEK